MALLVWFMTGIALWHFTIFLPDRFWQGIVGAFLGAVFGAIFSGTVAQIAIGSGIGETDLATVIYAVPGTMLGLAVIWAIGARSERTLTD
jgi:outer membrane lipoprotein SlyB